MESRLTIELQSRLTFFFFDRNGYRDASTQAIQFQWNDLSKTFVLFSSCEETGDDNKKINDNSRLLKWNKSVLFEDIKIIRGHERENQKSTA